MRKGPSFSLEAEILSQLPREFVAAYTELWDRAFGTGAGPAPTDGLGKAPRTYGKTRTTSSGVDTVGSAPGRSKADGRDPLVSERALHDKARVDRKLRALTRDLRARLDGVAESGMRQCAGRCKRYGEPRWIYCPHCGGPMADVDGG